jgi:hypothetical protein
MKTKKNGEFALPGFGKLAKRRAQPGCFVPPPHAFWRAWAAAGPAIRNPHEGDPNKNGD